MDIGTAKPTAAERAEVPHHMVDVADPGSEFTVAEFRRLGRLEMERTGSPTLLITGGSGLHFRALVDPMSFAPTDSGLRAELEDTPGNQLVGALLAADPGAGAHVDLANRRRVVRAVEVLRLTGETPTERGRSAEAEHLRRYVPEVEFTAVGIDPGEALDARVARRLGEMRAGGLVEEVAGLRGRLGRTASAAVGYREVLAALDGKMSMDEAFAAAARNTKRLARRQRTWFQRDPRIRWIPWNEDSDSRVTRVMEALG